MYTVLCPRCGASVPDDFPVCGTCGYDLTAPVTSLSPVAPGSGRPLSGDVSGRLDLREAGAGRPGAGPQAAGTGLPYNRGDVILDRFEIDQVMGEGPVGVVYSALDFDMDVQVAVKVVLSEYLPDRASLRRFGEWMAPARDLKHENIVRVYDLAPTDAHFAIVQQMIVGRSLADVLASRLPQGIASPRDEVEVLLTQLGEALAYAHPDGIHGGLKPQNVLLLPAGLVVTDFCLPMAIHPRAYLAGHRHRRLPVRYLAPELQAGQTCDHRADLYSLAVIAFELLVGIPFPGEPERQRDSMDALPYAAQEALVAALSTRPAGRPTDVDELVEGLLSAVSERTPTSPPAHHRPDTNVLDVSDLEEMGEEAGFREDDLSEDDFLEESTPVGVQPRGLFQDKDEDAYRPHMGDLDPEPWDAEPTPQRRSKPTRDLRPVAPGPSRRAPLPGPLSPRPARSTGPLVAPSVDPGVARAIPPALQKEPEGLAPALGGRRADPEARIEAAPELLDFPDIDADGKRPQPLSGLGSPLGTPKSRKVQDAAEALDFDKSLEDALAAAVAVPPPSPQRRRKRPVDKPDAEAMRDRPVAAGGEIQSIHSNPRMHLTQHEEPAVAVAEDAVRASTMPPIRREGTAQVPIPEGLNRRGLPWWLYLMLFGVACAAVVVGLVLYQRHEDRKTAEAAAERRARLGKLPPAGEIPRKPPAPRDAVRARALPLPPERPTPRPLAYEGPCPALMAHVKHRRTRFCVDSYEFPNRLGAQPRTAIDELEAAKQCTALGKRLCTRQEWELACGGPRSTLYAYGKRYKEGLCATADEKGARRPPEPSGSKADCKSHWGVFDLNGNMAEWVVGGHLLGGSAAKPGNQSSCASDSGSGGTAYNGFRCCAEAK